MTERLPWSEQHEAMLKKMIEAGKELPDIAAVFCNRTENGIRSKIKNMGLKINQRSVGIDMDAYAKIMKGVTSCL